MDFETWLYYFVAILVLTASPGPSVLLCLTKSVTHGFASSLYAALGSLTAIYIVMSLSFTGLGLVVAKSELAFSLIKWTGALYLIYLGFKALTSKQSCYETDTKPADTQISWRSHYLSGLIVGASNPKAIIFFSALLPQFINTSASMFQQYLLMASTFIVLELSWLLFYSHLGQRSSRWLKAEGRAKVFNRLSGGVFVGAGLFLSTTTRAHNNAI